MLNNQEVRFAGEESPRVVLSFGHKGGIMKSTFIFMTSIFLGTKSLDVLEEEEMLKEIEAIKQEFESIDDIQLKKKKERRIQTLERKYNKSVTENRQKNGIRRESTKNVLVIDLDFQRNVSRHLLSNEDYEEMKEKDGIFAAFDKESIDGFVKPSKYGENIHVLASSRRLSQFDSFMTEKRILKKRDFSKLLNDMIKDYVKEHNISYVLVDLSPSLNMLSLQGLMIDLDGEAVSTEVVVPSQSDGNTEESLEDIMTSVEENQSRNTKLKIKAFVPVLTSKDNKNDERIVKFIREELNDLVTTNVFERNERIREVFMAEKGSYNEHSKVNRRAYQKVFNVIEELGYIQVSKGDE